MSDIAFVPNPSAPLLPAMRESIPDWMWPVAILLLALWCALAARLWLRIRRTDRQSPETLRAILLDPKQLYMIGPAVVELRHRGESLGPCWERFVRLASSTDRVERMLGWQALQRGFPEIVASVAYEPRHASREARMALRARLLAPDAMPRDEPPPS